MTPGDLVSDPSHVFGESVCYKIPKAGPAHTRTVGVGKCRTATFNKTIRTSIIYKLTALQSTQSIIEVNKTYTRLSSSHCPT